MQERRSRILGLGGYVPPRVVTNQDMTQWMDTTTEWIVERTGIEERHWVEPGESGAGMAAKACREALEQAKVDPKEVDMLIYATLSPDPAEVRTPPGHRRTDRTPARAGCPVRHPGRCR